MSDINKIIEKLDKLIISNSNLGISQRSTGFRFKGIKPLIDAIETNDMIRIIVALPRIRKEDVWYDIKENVLEIVVNKNGYVYRKEIPCASKSEKNLKSTGIKNSVLEIILDKN